MDLSMNMSTLIISAIPLIFVMIFAVLLLLELGILYAKAGQPWWSVLLPIYGMYVYFKLAKAKALFFILLIAGACVYLMSEISRLLSGRAWIPSEIQVPRSGESYFVLQYYSGRNAQGSVVIEQGSMYVILIILLAFLIVGTIFLINRFALNFDRGPVFWVLVYLIPILGVFIIDGAEYIDRETDVIETRESKVTEDELRNLGIR